MTNLADLEARVASLEDDLANHKAKLAALGGPPKPLKARLVETNTHPELAIRIKGAR